MQISPIKANNTCSFGIKRPDTYNNELDSLILENFGTLVHVHSTEDCTRFMEATKKFKKENEKLLEKHFDVII